MSEAVVSAFEELKSKATNTSVLRLTNLKLPYIVATNHQITLSMPY
jgi:hypothetical protein